MVNTPLASQVFLSDESARGVGALDTAKDFLHFLLSEFSPALSLLFAVRIFSQSLVSLSCYGYEK